MDGGTMRLIDPGPGELLDRFTILDLKLRYAKGSTWHWIDEQAVIGAKLLAIRRQFPEEYEQWERDLHAVNEVVWFAVDAIREAEERSDTAAVAHWGLKALHGNDDRAAIIHRINTACGLVNGPEKIRT